MKQIIPLLLALLLFSCKDSSVNNNVRNSNNSIIFEVEYVNYAWGYSYNGIMIDNEGKEYSYDPAKDTIPCLYHEDGFYTERELQSKYEHTKKFITTLRSDSLNWSHNLANLVSTTNYSDTTQTGIDAGITTTSFYIYRPQVSKYQKIILKIEGDFSFYNRSQSAVTLAAWLNPY